MVDWVKEREERETKRHRTSLLGLLALIFVYSGVADDTPSAPSPRAGAALALEAGREEWPLSRRVCRLLLSLLRPVEAATRRLIVILAARLPVPEPRTACLESPPPRPTRAAGEAFSRSLGLAVFFAGPVGDGKTPPADTRPPLFALADPAKRYEWFFTGEPHNAGWQGPPPAGSPYDQLDAAAILRRIAALAGALDDLDAQARRLVRWHSRRIAARAAGKHVSLSPLRVGDPPGSLPRGAPKRTWLEEHHLLSETHALARMALKRLDTS